MNETHCWHSQEQEKLTGTSVYRVKFHGEIKEVHVTDASSSNTPNSCFSKWTDLQYVGYGTFVKVGRKATDYAYRPSLDKEYKCDIV